MSELEHHHSERGSNNIVAQSKSVPAMQLEKFDELITSLYSCIDHKDGFTPFLQLLRKVFDVKTVALFCMRVKPFKGLYTWVSGYPPGFIKMLVKTGAIAKDESVMRAAREPSGSVYCFSDCRPDYDIAESVGAFSKAWLKAVGVTDNAALTFEMRSGERAVLMFNRAGKQGIFNRLELELLARLQPHVHRALVLYESLSHQKNVSDGLTAAIDSLDYPVALFSMVGRLVNVNPAFRELGKTHAILHIDDNTQQIVFTDKSTDAEFSRCLASSLTTEEQKQANIELIFVKTKALPVRLMLRPLYDKNKQVTAVMVEARDANTAIDFDCADVQKVIDCTQAEAKLVVRLLLGDDLNTAAEAMSLSLHTVRGYVKSVMNKNDFHRQVDLVAALLKVLG